MVHTLPAIEALESASNIQAFSYAQSYTAPLYPLETFPVEVSQSVYEAWMPEEQWSAAGVPSFSWGFLVNTPNEAGSTEDENPVIEAAHQD
ncbi:hypothetical protein NUW54_g943 [Trametes sanguinea]|uniref:Uncharacterized protein n=2 Tax=Trametes sanguinea TaxID=158606 RepID=A0ACC1Q017_9APHY|nr:hypothetical protein NUW54_g4923 [Trametes sanguinea]KAJ3015831.1 hypothetical protein NUW54_g943 [Trametes sanguinea]